MQRCPNCGTMFDGKFCPECGAEYKDNKQCPKCGAPCGAGDKFCPVCGYSFSGKTAAAPAEYKKMTLYTAGRLHRALSVLPAALFGLFTVLSLIFFALPTGVAVTFLGEESCGSIYQIFGGYATILDVRGCTIAAMIFGLCGVPVTLFAALFTFSRLNAGENMRYGKYGTNFLPIALGCEYAIYVALIVISSVILAKIPQSENLLVQVNTGACPILLLVFSIMFAVFSAACNVADFLIRKKYPAIVDTHEPREYTNPYPVCPKTVPAPVETIKRGNILYTHMRAMRFADRISVIGIIMGLVMIIFSYVLFSANQSSNLSFEDIILYSSLIWLLVAVIALLVSAKELKKKKTYYNFNHAQKRLTRLWVYTIISAILLLLSVVRLIVAMAITAHDAYGANNVGIFICNLLPIALNLIICLIAFKITGKANIALVGQKKLKGGELTAEGKKLVETDEKYISQLRDYSAYKKEMKKYNAECKKHNFEKDMCQNGLDYKNSKARAAFAVEQNGNRLILIALAVIVAIVIAVVIPAAVIKPETVEGLTQTVDCFADMLK